MTKIAGKPLYRSTTHLIVDTESGRLISQHRSEKAATGGMKFCRGAMNFSSLKIVPVAEAIARFGCAA